MTWGTLVLRGLRFHWRAHLGVLLGATLATAILAGALAVGDSVRHSLREMALARLGGVDLAIHAPSRFFRAALAGDLAGQLKLPVAPALLLRGTAAAPRSGTRTGGVQVIGSDDRFWQLGGTPPPAPGSGERVVLNTRLAARLGIGVGEEVLLRVEKPGLLAREAPLSTVEETSVVLRLPVAAVLGDEQFGRFSLEANQIPPLNAFVPLAALQRAIALLGRANALLVGGADDRSVAPAEANRALWERWQLADAGLALRELFGRGLLELTTDQVFLEPTIVQAATGALPGAQGILTYFVNELRAGRRATPYSTVAALSISGFGFRVSDLGLGKEVSSARRVRNAQSGHPRPGVIRNPQFKDGDREVRDDEIVINSWLADDLAAGPGAEIRLSYFVVGPLRRLEQRSRRFRVRAVVPMSGLALDPGLMPDFPGVADTENCRDWEPGIPIDLERIRDRDEAYWDRYRGTPKAFVTLAAGQRMWNNRFGNLTAIRYPLPGGAGNADARLQAEACLRQAVNPASIGLYFQPVREQALAASSQALDFGQLFLGFSSFLLIAGLLLTALLFTLGMEQRAEEVGTLLALGFPLPRVRALFLLEGAALAMVASVAGTFLGALYTQGVVRGLGTVWRGAVAGSALRYHAEPATFATGAVAGFFAALLSIWLVARKQGRAPVRELLTGEAAIRNPQPLAHVGRCYRRPRHDRAGLGAAGDAGGRVLWGGRAAVDRRDPGVPVRAGTTGEGCRRAADPEVAGGAEQRAAAGAQPECHCTAGRRQLPRGGRGRQPARRQRGRGVSELRDRGLRILRREHAAGPP